MAKKKVVIKKTAAGKSTDKERAGKKAAAKKVTAKKKAVAKTTAKRPVNESKQPAAKAARKKAVAKVAAAGSVTTAAAGPAWAREGAAAPDFTAIAHDGSKIKLSAFKGRPVVLYFYPKDDTPGCTVEACGFRDAHARFGRHKAVVIGVSPDSPGSHERFRAKHRLPFTLVADENHAVASAYGAWRKKSLYGKTFMGVARSTFVIDAAGTIAKAFTAVKPAGHETQVLAAVAALS